MRAIVSLLVGVAVASCGTDRSTPGFSTGTSRSTQAALTLRVIDDPAGAVDVTSAASRPTVSLVFEATGEGGTTFRFTGAGQVHMVVPVDSTQATSTLFVDNVPAARFDRLSLRLISAQRQPVRLTLLQQQIPRERQHQRRRQHIRRRRPVPRRCFEHRSGRPVLVTPQIRVHQVRAEEVQDGDLRHQAPRP